MQLMCGGLAAISPSYNSASQKCSVVPMVSHDRVVENPSVAPNSAPNILKNYQSADCVCRSLTAGQESLIMALLLFLRAVESLVLSSSPHIQPFFSSLGALPPVGLPAIDCFLSFLPPRSNSK